MISKKVWKNQNLSSLINLSTKSCLVLVTVTALTSCSNATGDATSKDTKVNTGKTIVAELEGVNQEGEGKESVDDDRSYLNLSLTRTKSIDKRKDQLNANYHFNAAEQFREDKKYNEAIAEYKKAIRAYPQDGAFYKNLGGTFALVGKLDDAEAVLNKGTQVNPKDWLMWNNLAVVKQNLNKIEECKDAIKKSLSLKPPKYAQENMELTLKQLESSTN